ncbi:hypothetical protein FACS1894172_17080 [Spirochaetia bacterium]|nr:hypothetical protein FACS1894172_17080 [Spirochaetia bacterium]
MTMDGVFDTLRTLQDVLTEKISLENEVRESPKALESQEDVLEHYKKNFIEKNRDYEKARNANAEYINQIFEAEKSREEAEKKMELLTSARESEALQKEITVAKEKETQSRKAHQREEKYVAELKTEMDEMHNNIALQEKELAERKSKINLEIAEKNQRIGELNAQEQELIPDLDPDVLFKFERIVKNKMGKGIVAIHGGVCTGCYMVLPVQFANEVRAGEDVIFCPYCSRILFYEETDDKENFFDDADLGSLVDIDDMDEDEEDE